MQVERIKYAIRLPANQVLQDRRASGLWALGAEDDVLVRLIKKTLSMSGSSPFLIGNFNALAKSVFNSFAGAMKRGDKIVKGN